jgi:hypothetical protein
MCAASPAKKYALVPKVFYPPLMQPVYCKPGCFRKLKFCCYLLLYKGDDLFERFWIFILVFLWQNTNHPETIIALHGKQTQKSLSG